MKRSPLARVSKDRARKLARRAAAVCTCGAIGDEHAWACAARSATRRKPLPQRRDRKRRSSRVVDLVFMKLVHELPCCARLVDGHRCEGPIVAHHAGPRWDHGGGAKCDDDKTIPICDQGHKDLHGSRTTGTFKGWTKEMMRAWQDIRILETQPRIARMRSTPGPRAEEQPC